MEEMIEKSISGKNKKASHKIKKKDVFRNRERRKKK